MRGFFAEQICEKADHNNSWVASDIAAWGEIAASTDLDISSAEILNGVVVPGITERKDLDIKFIGRTISIVLKTILKEIHIILLY